jgi:hypothetical protein
LKNKHLKVDLKLNQHNHFRKSAFAISTMEERTLKNINNCFNTNIYSFLETSGGQSSNPYLNVVHFLNIRAD